MKIILGILAFVVASASLSSCVEGDEKNTLEAAKKNIECVYNSDCPEGLVCGYYSGRCEQCYLDTHCGQGKRCSPAGECVAQCKSDRDCAAGECKDGVCEDGIAAGGAPNVDIEEYLDGGTTGIDWLDELLDEFRDYIENGGDYPPGGWGDERGGDDYGESRPPEDDDEDTGE
ncbi:MAG: hypothetical protein Kow0090_10500 [Myxococcota bacterium]